MSTLKYWNGTAWTAAFPPASPAANDVQDFVTSGTYTKPVGARWLFYEMIGGGGAGNNPSFNSNKRGGTGGNYVCGIISADSIGDTEPVTVGAGATAPALGSNGAAGGASTFGGITTGTSRVNPGSGGGSGYVNMAIPMMFDGGYGASANSTYQHSGSSSVFGAGGGGDNGYSRGLGGTGAVAAGRLKAGDGGTWSTHPDGFAPGGGGACGSGTTPVPGAGAPGAVRITAIF